MVASIRNSHSTLSHSRAAEDGKFKVPHPCCVRMGRRPFDAFRTVGSADGTKSPGEDAIRKRHSEDATRQGWRYIGNGTSGFKSKYGAAHLKVAPTSDRVQPSSNC
jgi:hypothetical protein